jgi:hypothetical protein
MPEFGAVAYHFKYSIYKLTPSCIKIKYFVAYSVLGDWRWVRCLIFVCNYPSVNTK